MKNKLAVPILSSCGGQEDILLAPLDFESCVNMLGGDRAMLLGLLSEFSGNLEIQVEAIAVALAESNSDVVCKVAHSIKGGAAVLSAHSLMNAAAALEEIGKSGDLPKSEDCFLILAREVARLRCYCKDLMNNDA
jgi:HPt (histidine-containing phosphotransfer) domain-containing protein